MACLKKQKTSLFLDTKPASKLSYLFTFKAADTHVQSHAVLFLPFFTCFKCASAIFRHPMRTHFPTEAAVYKSGAERRRVVLVSSPLIQKKLIRLKTSLHPVSHNPLPSNTQPLHSSVVNKSPAGSVSVDSTETDLRREQD